MITWYFIPKVKVKKAFSFATIKNVIHFAASMGAGAILVAFIFETDKLVLSKTLPGPAYGYYMFAVGLAMMVYNISLPISMAVFPHFTNYYHKKEIGLLEKDFHKYTRIMAVLLIPFSIVLFGFANQI
ncbi:MAG: oligosaccharide flippase family protein [Ferruginibacter sp.]